MPLASSRRTNRVAFCVRCSLADQHALFLRTTPALTPHEFIAKWKQSTLTERSACQQHFLDLCELLDQPKPAAADPDGAFYTFERGVKKTSGESGWADVWFQDRFGWEYMGNIR